MQDDNKEAREDFSVQLTKVEKAERGGSAHSAFHAAGALETSDTLIEPSQFAKGSQNQGAELAVAETIAASDTGSGRGESFQGSGPQCNSGDTDSKLGPGESLGRLVLGDTLGSGAFGRVVSAYDPELKRKLAVKILKSEVFQSLGGQDAQRRLLREARAMAKISHANVVTVHDIGMVDEQVYVAMEFVEGGNMRDWLDQESRSWQEILAKFTDAGKGLAAAHRVELVHRDFKPDNVLVGSDGRVCVADFGLVSIGRRGDDNVRSSEFPTGIASEEINLTQAGALMGTALFMAPEQHLGKEVTPACDQFAFCVSLYVALCGKQPYVGTTYKQLRQNVLRGNLRGMPKGSKVPRWLRRLVTKGLARHAEDRHESMDSLLEALQKPPSSRWSRGLRLLAIPVVGLSLYGAYSLSPDEKSERCEDPDKRLHGVWDSSTQAAIAQSFAVSGSSAGYAVYQNSIDRQVADWRAAYARVCEQSVSESAAAQTENSAQQDCLNERLHYLRRLNSELSSGADRSLLNSALKVVVNLPPLSQCANDRTEPNEASPLAAEDRKAVAALHAAREKAQALFDLGKFSESIELLEEALRIDVSHARTRGLALFLLGEAKTDVGQLEEAELLLQRTVEEGTLAGDDILVARAWLALHFIEGTERENFPRSREYARMAELSMLRGRANERQLAQLSRSRATVLFREGKAKDSIELLEKILPIYEAEGANTGLANLLSLLGDAKVSDRRIDEALEHYKLALAHIESLVGADHPENIYVLNNMSVALKYQGDIRGAKDVLERSLALTEKNMGETSFSLVPILTNLTSIYRRLEMLEKAEAAGLRAIAVGKNIQGGEAQRVVKAMTNLAIVRIAQERYREATLLFREILQQQEKSFEGDHPALASAMNNLGESLVSEDKADEALNYLLQAKEMKERIFGEGHAKVASTYVTLASAYDKMQNDDEAVRFLKSALLIYEEKAGDSYPRTIYVRSYLARVELKRGKAGNALSLFEKAIADRGSDAKLRDQARDRFGVVQSLWAVGRKSEASAKGKKLATEIEGDDKSVDLAKEVKTWVLAH